jgi:hypothetical protein
MMLNHPLFYHDDQPMMLRAASDSPSLSQVAAQLRQALAVPRSYGDPPPIVMVLEPGDATRYALKLWLHEQSELIVARLHGGRRNGDTLGLITVPVYGPAVITPDMAQPLSYGNAWSGTLIAWWLTHLMHELHAR